MTSLLRPMCYACIHLYPVEKPMACEAFPDGIPEDILLSMTDHRLPQPDDNGIHFDQNPALPVFPFEDYEPYTGESPFPPEYDEPVM